MRGAEVQRDHGGGSAVTPETRPLRCPSVVAVELDGEVVLYEEQSGALHLLDPIGTVVWSGLDGLVTIADLAAELATIYQGEQAVIERDVLGLVRDLAELGLVVTHAGTASTADGADGLR